MKNTKILMVIALVFGLTSVLEAQYCDFFPMSKNKVLSYQNFNHKGKITSKSKTTCNDVITDSTGATIYKVKTEISDADGSYISSRDYAMKCKDGKFYIDMVSYAGSEEMNAFHNMDVDVNTKEMTYPDELLPGTDLPDANITISTKPHGEETATLVILVTNRKVVSTDSVTVPAGTFECVKITYDMEIKWNSNAKYRISEYIALGEGKIKTETYSEKNKLESYSVLTELIK